MLTCRWKQVRFYIDLDDDIWQFGCVATVPHVPWPDKMLAILLAIRNDPTFTHTVPIWGPAVHREGVL